MCMNASSLVYGRTMNMCLGVKRFGSWVGGFFINSFGRAFAINE